MNTFIGILEILSHCIQAEYSLINTSNTDYTLEQYAISLERRTVSSSLSPMVSFRALMAWALAARRQSRTHSLAEVWMTPPPRLPGERERN